LFDFVEGLNHTIISSSSATMNTSSMRANGKGVLPSHEELVLNGWTLVRHCPAGVRWHRATDHLKGTEEYGDSSLGDHPNAPEWSKKFESSNFDEFLFSTGDGSRWMVVDRSEIIATKDNDLKSLRITRSSLNAIPHSVKYMNCSENPCEPWIALKDHESAKSDDGAGFLYGGGSFNVSPVEDDLSQPNALAAAENSMQETKLSDEAEG
jgi:hypothetical protein